MSEFYRSKLDVSGEFSDGEKSEEPKSSKDEKKLVRVHPNDANIISSRKTSGKHNLILDIDKPAALVESSTPNHYHIYIEANLKTEDLEEIVDVLVKHGILQKGIKNQLERHGFLSLRPPGVSKYSATDNKSLEELLNVKSE